MVQQVLDKKLKKGFSTLLVVIIIGVMVMGLILYISTTSYWSVRQSVDDKVAMQTEQMVNACAESALETMRENNSFTGGNSLTIGSDTCNYTVTNTGGNNRSINITSTIKNITRNLTITTSAFNPLVISSWQE
jgi:Tfp pilus assembly protein PilV